MMTIKGKVVLITGAGHGIGAAIAERLAEQGARVAITYREDRVGAQKLVAKYNGINAAMKAYYVADLADDKQCATLFSRILKDFGRIDVVVANAGNVGKSAAIHENLHDINLKEWHQSFNANLLVAITTAKHAIKTFDKKGRGKLVFIGSVHGVADGNPRVTAYSAAKAATHNFARTIAKTLAPNIIVNVVSPGRCWANGYDTLSKDELAVKFAPNKHGRPIEWDEIAQAVQMVLENDSIIGQIINVDAGFTLLPSY